MIIKGGSRAAPRSLAKHLMRGDTNERVLVLGYDGVAIEDLNAALADMQALASGTRGKKGLYHANIDPHTDYKMTPEQWDRCVAVLEKELGLEGQPRVVVLHEKKGREHIHVVWARTDIDTMTLRSDSNNYLAHERASHQLEAEFGHEHVPGAHYKRDKSQDRPVAKMNRMEWQQSERSGLDPIARKAEITALYEQSDNGQAFRNALEEHGYVLANGDKRVFVVVDIAGDIHSLNRQVTSAKAKDIREKIADIDPASLPDVAEAQEIQEQRRDARRSASGREEAEEGRTTAEAPAKSQEALPILAPDDPALAEARADLNQNHDRRREIFAQDWDKRIAREMDLVNRQINEQRDIERKLDWKQMEPGKGIERFEHKLKDRLDPKRISDRYDERQQREKERDVRDAERRAARMAELQRDREQAREKLESKFDQEHSQLEDMHRRDQERARQQELDRARDPQSPDNKPPDRGGGYDR
ncbi:hypothetical protein GCM10007972_13000 [Iodidimonas muriae]|uniref:MobA/VirD2-like nuclease domain-containing protein n=1 Tax=Iodidimonas muriae TaxID=261467 RepID=A0ABQ2LC95_9PROT|nr:relaxase/mobilization nuclease domain-containing protein [Iodidimonas muriae]GER06695.1 hypothetical protein JCM17843_10050 [Kordiimonadales bacterium JCM 17843]GGO10346.1 hypothetical protein GCM10007972_13000 [Iodidimonas muriae]